MYNDQSRLTRLFSELARRVTSRWRARGFQSDAFSDVAEQTLRETTPAARIDAAELVRWVQLKRDLPPQRRGRRSLESSVTVLRNDRFLIEVLFWDGGATGIHEHDSAGAFHVLTGARAHAVYDFRPDARVAGDLTIGRLETRTFEVLRAGAIRQVVPSRDFIHALFFIERPCLTLSIRNLGLSPARIYHAPCARVARSDHALAEKLRLLDFEREFLPRQFESTVANIAASCDPLTAFSALLHAHDALPTQRWERLVRRARAKRGDWVDAVRGAAQDRARRLSAYHLGRHVEKFEHGLLLALLWDGCGPDQSREVVRGAFPRRDPARLIARSIDEVAAISTERNLGEIDWRGLTP